MKITLVQSEIEAAIQLYLGSQMTIAKGVSINIELRATRGDEGYMAMIDIRPGQIPLEQLSQNIAVNNTRMNEIQKPAPVLAQAAPEESEEVESEDDNEEEVVVEAASSPKEEVAPAPFVADGADKSEKPTGRGGRSLFGGLKKPTNAVAN